MCSSAYPCFLSIFFDLAVWWLLFLSSHWVMSNSFATLWTIACQAPLSMGFPRQEYWSGLPFPSPGNLPDPRIEPTSPDWHHWLNGYEFEHTPGYSEGQERRACCSLWGCRVGHDFTTEQFFTTKPPGNSLPQSHWESQLFGYHSSLRPHLFY